MPENKTQPTRASVAGYLAAIKDSSRRKDCETLTKLMSKASKHPPQMWGPSIVGFGSYHYRYESGREGDMCIVGFSSRADSISVYGLNVSGAGATLAKLGKHKVGKGCLYIKALADVDEAVLARLVASAVARKSRKA